MNCQTYRQKCTLEPKFQEKEFISHQQACSDCAAFTKDMMQFEQSLIEAINVEIPDGLTQRILQGQFKKSSNLLVKFNDWLKSIFYFPPVYAIAASLFLLITMFSNGWWQANADTVFLKQEIINYIENTPQAFQIDKQKQVPAAELHMMFQKIGAKMTGDIGKVSFCKVLTLHGYRSAYMVLSGTKGPINVLLIRNSKISQPQNINHVKFKGIIRATKWGNIAIIGVGKEPLEQIAKRINEKLIWL